MSTSVAAPRVTNRLPADVKLGRITASFIIIKHLKTCFYSMSRMSTSV